MNKMSGSKIICASLFLLPLLAVANLNAQNVYPITRFHAVNAPGVRYHKQFLSGFMQTAQSDTLKGFLQMPYIGRPVWVYVGEKDSTQYMAYASGYRELADDATTNAIDVLLSRYNVRARLLQKGRVCEQHYTYPDTTAEKGFLLDIDHALGGKGNEDMEVKFVDRQTIRAYKRSYDARPGDPQLYYYAHFSHPYESYNVRREHVRLENGQREMRLKAAFSFDLRSGEELVVTSSVSDRSMDDAYAMLEGHRPARTFNDERKRRPADEPLLATAMPQQKPKPQRTKVAAVTKPKAVPQRATKPPVRKQTQRQEGLADKVVVETRDASMRAAFYAAFDYLQQLPHWKNSVSADAWLEQVTTIALAKPVSEPELTDSALYAYAAGCMSGQSIAGDTDGHRAAWFLLRSMGLLPAKGCEGVEYNISSPLYNVVTLYYNGDRRFILHTKSNTVANRCILKATWNGATMSTPAAISSKQLLRGGVLAVKMGREM